MLRRIFAKTVRNPVMQGIAGLSLMAGVPYAANTYVNHDMNPTAVTTNDVTEQYRTRLSALKAEMDSINELRDYKGTDEYKALEEDEQTAYTKVIDDRQSAYNDVADQFSLDLMSDPRINEKTYAVFNKFYDMSRGEYSTKFGLDGSHADSLNECRAEHLNSPAGTKRQIQEQIFTCATKNNEDAFWFTVVGIIAAAVSAAGAHAGVSRSSTLRDWSNKPKPTSPKH